MTILHYPLSTHHIMNMPAEIAISHFKTHCLEIIDKLQTNKQSIVITKRGRPVAKIDAIVTTPKTSLFNMLNGRAKITGDIICHIDDQWDAERD